jgi:hypothetical protein
MLRRPPGQREIEPNPWTKARASSPGYPARLSNRAPFRDWLYRPRPICLSWCGLLRYCHLAPRVCGLYELYPKSPRNVTQGQASWNACPCTTWCGRWLCSPVTFLSYEGNSWPALAPPSCRPFFDAFKVTWGRIALAGSASRGGRQFVSPQNCCGVSPENPY